MLQYDIDWSQLINVGDELEASDKQIKFALTRALRRTEATLRRMSSKGLQRELQLRAATALRKRLKTVRLRKVSTQGGGNAVGLWYGLNPLPVSAFKGNVRQTPTGATKGAHNFEGAFVGRSKFKKPRTIFKRKGPERLAIEEQTMDIEDRAIVFIEDQVFDQVEDIFWQHFRRDLAARVKYQLGGR